MADRIKIAGSYLNDATLPTWDREGLKPAAMAYDGQIGTGSIGIRESGSYDKFSGRRITLEVGGVTAADGFIGGKERVRPEDDALLRLNIWTWQDNNRLLAHIRVESWNRPAETDRARVLAAMAAFCPALDTSLYVPNTNNVNMPKKKYTDTDLISILSDCMDQSAKTFFADRGRYFHYHLLEEDVGFNASVSITDSGADGITSFAPSFPDKQSDPYDLSNDMKVTGSGTHSVTVTDATSISEHNVDGLKFEDTIAFPDSDDPTDLTNYGNAVLSTRKEDRDSWKCDLAYLPSPTLLDAGMRIEVTSAVMGLTATHKRIASISWETSAPGLWTAHLELGSPKRAPYELRHRRRSGVGGGLTETALNLTRYDLFKEDGSQPIGPDSLVGTLYDTITPSFTFGALSSVTQSKIQKGVYHNVPWEYVDCGLLNDASAGRAWHEAWYRFDVDLSDPDLTHVRLDIAALTVTGRATGSTLICGVALATPTDRGQYTQIATIDAAGGTSVKIPRANLQDSGVGHCWFVLAPGWDVPLDMVLCNTGGYANAFQGEVDADPNDSTRKVTAAAVAISSAQTSTSPQMVSQIFAALE